VTVRLYELNGMALIVSASTGIVYVNQTGGHACYQCSQEGYLVPLGPEEREREALDALRAHFMGPKWSGWCNEGIDAETADEIEAIISHPEFEDLSRSSGLPVAFGHLMDGRLVIVVYRWVDQVTVQPITAYEVPE